MPHPQRISATMHVAHSLMIHGALPVHRLLSHGITRHQVAAVVHAGELARIRSGVLIDAHRWCAGDAESRLRTAIAAAHAARPGGVAVAQTAAALWRLPMFDSDSKVRLHVAGASTQRASTQQASTQRALTQRALTQHQPRRGRRSFKITQFRGCTLRCREMVSVQAGCICTTLKSQKVFDA